MKMDQWVSEEPKQLSKDDCRGGAVLYSCLGLFYTVGLILSCLAGFLISNWIRSGSAFIPTWKLVLSFLVGGLIGGL